MKTYIVYGDNIKTTTFEKSREARRFAIENSTDHEVAIKTIYNGAEESLVSRYLNGKKLYEVFHIVDYQFDYYIGSDKMSILIKAHTIDDAKKRFKEMVSNYQIAKLVCYWPNDKVEIKCKTQEWFKNIK